MPSFEHLLNRYEQRRRAIRNRAAHITGPVQLYRKSGTYAILHPTTCGVHPWQITRFDEFGPYSDGRRQTLLEVAIIAIEEGFRFNQGRCCHG